MHSELLSVGQVAYKLQVRPDQISNLFYKRFLRDDLCPIVAGRRLIPPNYVPVIAAALRQRGIDVHPDWGVERPGKTVKGEGGDACPE
jgi:hypothetical protein